MKIAVLMGLIALLVYPVSQEVAAFFGLACFFLYIREMTPKVDTFHGGLYVFCGVLYDHGFHHTEVMAILSFIKGGVQ